MLETNFYQNYFLASPLQPHPKEISAALKRDTSKVLDHGVSLQSWRQVTVAFSAAHKDPEAIISCDIDPDNEIRGHSNMVAETHYANNPTTPQPHSPFWR
jgi:hypothetical protein